LRREPKIAEIESLRHTPETPKDRRRSRRSNLFTPKKLDLNEADSTESITKENTSTPQRTPEIRDEPKTPEKTPDRKLRRRTTGNMTPKQRLHSKLKRMSSNPVELEKLISRYGKLQPEIKIFGEQLLAKHKSEQQNDQNKENSNNSAMISAPAAKGKLPLPQIVNPSTPVIVNRVEMGALTPKMINTPTQNVKTPKPVEDLSSIRSRVAANLDLHPEKVDECETPASKFAKEVLSKKEKSKDEVETEDLIATTDSSQKIENPEFSFELSSRAESRLSTCTMNTTDLLASAPQSPGSQLSSAPQTPQNCTQSEKAIMDSPYTPQPHTPHPPVTKNREEPIEDCKTPGQTAMKELFSENAETNTKTPNQTAMKHLFVEKKAENATPNQTAMKKLFVEDKIRGAQTPNQTAMKGLFAEKKSEMATPNQTSMKTLFAEDKETANTPNQAAMKTLFQEEKIQPKTPSNTALKHLFNEDASAPTPDQSAMKVLFRPEINNDAQSPDQSAVKGIFKEQAEQESVEPGPTAMKNLFVDEKSVDTNQTLAPDDGSVAVIFGSPVQEKIVEKNPFAGDQKSINWASAVVDNNIVISNIDFNNEDDLSGMNILIENASKDNYLLAGLFAEPKEKNDDMNETALFDEKVMDVLFEEPMEVVLDDEISISTAAVITHLKSEKASRTRNSARKLGAPPSSKKSVTVGRRRTRSMDKADVAQKLDFEREEVEPEPKPVSRKTRRLQKKTEEKDQNEETKSAVIAEPEVKSTSTRKARRLPRKEVNVPYKELETNEEESEVQEPAPGSASKALLSISLAEDACDLEDKTEKEDAVENEEIPDFLKSVPEEPPVVEKDPKPKKVTRRVKKVEDEPEEVKKETSKTRTRKASGKEEVPKPKESKTKKTRKGPLSEESSEEETNPKSKRSKKKVVEEVNDEEIEDGSDGQEVIIGNPEDQKEIVKPKAAKKKPTSKKNKMLERQKKIVDGVKKEVRKRIQDGEDPGPAPEVIMEPVQTKSSLRSGRTTRRAVTFDQDDAEPDEEDQEEEVEEKATKTSRRTRKPSKEDSPSEVVVEKQKTGRRTKKPSKEDDPIPVEKKAAVKKTTRKAKAEVVLENGEEEKPKRTRKTKVAEEEKPESPPKKTTRRRQASGDIVDSPPKKAARGKVKKQDIPVVEEPEKKPTRSRAKKAAAIDSEDPVTTRSTRSTRSKK
jgi:hypothetical protein